MPASSVPPNSPSLVPPSHFGRRLALRLALSLGVAGAFGYFLFRIKLRVFPHPSDFASVRWWTVALYFALYGVVHFFRALRWDYLLRPLARVPTRHVIALSFVGFLGIMVLPLRMGEVVRPYLIRQKGHVSGSAAMGTIAAERVLDGFYVALLLAGALAFVPRRPLDGVTYNGFAISTVPRLGYAMTAVFGTALVVLAIFLWQRAWAERTVHRLVDPVSPRLATRLSGIVGGLADGLRSLPDPRLMIPFTGYSAVYWIVNALSMWVLGVGCGLPMTPGQGFAVMGVLAMGILVPAGPGLFGAFQLAVYAALLMYFPESVVVHQGTAYVFLMWAMQLLFHVVAGVVPLFTEHLSLVDAMSGGAAHTATNLETSRERS